MAILDRNDAAKTVNYTYDGFGRLKTAATQGTHWGLSWTYDRYGNRLSQTATKGAPPTHTLSVNASTNRVTGWSYDLAGNTLNDGVHSYSYDASNRVKSVDGSGALFKHDAAGRRVDRLRDLMTGGRIRTLSLGAFVRNRAGELVGRLAATLGDGNLIYINSDIPFDNPGQSVFVFNEQTRKFDSVNFLQIWRQAFGSQLTADDFRSGIILHELAHSLGLFGPDAPGTGPNSSIEQNANQRAIQDACF